MMLEKVAQHHVAIKFSKEDCQLLAHTLTMAQLYETTKTGQAVARAWLTATATVFEAAALMGSGARSGE